MGNIFLSYNRQSEAIARTLVQDIEALGHTVWFDQELKGGQAWWDQILAEVRKCDVFIFLLDPKALKSTACQREYGYAADLGKPILPVLVAEGISASLLPHALSQIQFIDYCKQDRDAFRRLVRALTTIPPAKPLPESLPHPPEVPISYLGRLTQQIEGVATLRYEEQSALLVDLKRALQDPETHNDALALLELLRKQRELLAPIAAEIDEVLRSLRQASTEEQATPRPAATESSSEEARVLEHKTPRISWFKRINWYGVVMILGMASIGGVMLYSQLFSPKIDIVVEDLDWEPSDPSIGQAVKFTAKYSAIYTIREFVTRFSTQVKEVQDKPVSGVFEETWSVAGVDTTNDVPRKMISGKPEKAIFERVFSKPGKYTITFTIKTRGVNDEHPTNNSFTRTISVSDNK